MKLRGFALLAAFSCACASPTLKKFITGACFATAAIGPGSGFTSLPIQGRISLNPSGTTALPAGIDIDPMPKNEGENDRNVASLNGVRYSTTPLSFEYEYTRSAKFDVKDSQTVRLAKLYARHKAFLDLPCTLKDKPATLLEYYLLPVNHPLKPVFGEWYLEFKDSELLLNRFEEIVAKGFELDYVRAVRMAFTVYNCPRPSLWDKLLGNEPHATWDLETPEQLHEIQRKAKLYSGAFD
ncbi:MAG: hypothetical protein SGCHY_003531 [Lobulomycetales sp.]